ncbi:MAG TPA: carbohydrate ABC transporter permease [Candidatus Limiplasma sp.]|nr:carbohydrate ABC transporter permease [Candidatus Limiplasma sp.]HPR77572.1 carbohydrate ABC transporter permease [Candidatus Limiplasma sp.]
MIKAMSTAKKPLNMRILRQVLMAALLVLIFFVMVFPFFYMLTSSLKNDQDVFTKSMFYVPNPPIWNNYGRVWTEISFLQYYLNTIKITVLATALQLFISATAAYAFARMQVPFKNFFFTLFISTMMVPWTAVMIPQFILVSSMGLYDSHASLILLQGFNAFGIFMLRQFFMGIPNELSEAAVLDGCGHWRIFTRIMLPLSKSSIAALLIFSFIKVWNDYLAPLIYLQTPGKRTVQLGLSLFYSQYSMEYGVIMAGTVCALLPVLVLYIFCEKQITTGIAFSGMKN